MSLHAKVEHISYTTGTRALPVYMHSPLGLCVRIRQSTLAHGISITCIGGGKGGGGGGGAKGLKPPPRSAEGGLSPPQNDITPKLSFLEWG